MKPRTAPNPAPDLRNDEAERAVIGRVLIDASTYGDVAARLRPESFADKRHQVIFRGIAAVIATHGIVNRSTLLSQIGDIRQEEIGDSVSLATYLAGLTAQAAQPEFYAVPAAALADAVAHPAARRDLIAAADAIRDRAAAATLDTPIEEIRAAASKIIADNDNRVVHEARPIGLVVSDVIRDTNQAVKTGKRPGLRTGLKAFDKLVGPMLPGQLIVIAGETSAGKTALAMQLAYMVAGQGHQVRIASLEMQAEELAMRYLAQFAGIDTERIVDARLTSADFDLMMAAGERLYDVPLDIDDQPRLTVGMLHARTARDILAKKCKLAIIDHLQYVRPDGRGEEREQIKQVVDDIKAMAKRLNIPVILISHVTRPAEMVRINQASDIKLPTLNILYGSSAIEKAADAVVFVHRPIWFLERNAPLPKFRTEHADDVARWRGRAQLVLPKRRMGKGHGIRECEFDEAKTWFRDLAEVEAADLPF